MNQARKSCRAKGSRRAVRPVFTLEQAKALRVAISWAREGEDASFNRVLVNAHRQLDIAIED